MLLLNRSVNRSVNRSKPLLDEGATATAGLPRRASVAMIGNRNWFVLQVTLQQICQVGTRLFASAQRNMQHLVKVAIAYKALPINTQQTFAHDSVEVFCAICVF